MAEPRTYRLFGAIIAVHADLTLRANEVDEVPDVSVHVVVDEPPADWERAEELFSIGSAAPRDEPAFRFFRLPDRDVIRVVGAADVHLMDEQLLFHLKHPDHRYLIEIVLLGLGMAFWLERRGTAVLHASAIDLDGDAVAFIAAGGTGKSSLAAYLTANGDPLITEDLLALSWQDGVPLAEPAVGQFRLWPEVAANYSTDWTALAQPHPGFSKRKLPVGNDGIGRLAQHPVRLRRIYVLERIDDPSHAPTIVPLSGGDGFAQLLKHSFLPEIAEKFGWDGRRLRQLAQLMAATPVRVLRYPSGTDHLATVRDAISRDLER